MTYTPNAPQIHGLMAQVMADIGAVGKNDRNDQQNYSFRGIDAVMNAVHSAMTAHSVIVTPKVIGKEYGSYRTKNGAEMRLAVLDIEYTFWAPDGSSITVLAVGEASDSADKATNKAMAAAFKYALLHTFVVPTADVVREDADRSGEERGAQTVDLGPYLNAELATEEKTALRAAWTERFDFRTHEVPFGREQEARTLIESFVGTIPPGKSEGPAEASVQDHPAPEPQADQTPVEGSELTVDLTGLVELLTQKRRKHLDETWAFDFSVNEVPKEFELEARELINLAGSA